MERIAVTGAGGKVGVQVVQELMDQGYQVVSITHSYSGCPGEEISLDVRDYSGVYEALDGCTGVIHLAAIPSPGKERDDLVMSTNLVGTYNVLRAAGNRGIKRAAVASTDCTLGFTFSKNRPEPVYLPVDEKHPLQPDDSYGLSKVLMERTAEAVVQRFPGMSIASLRITYVSNPEEYKEGSNFRKWTQNPDTGPFNLWSYIDNRDAARAFRLAVETDFAGHEIFVIAADNTRCTVPSSELIARYFPGVKMKKDLSNHRSLEDNTKAKELLGFTPEHRWNS